MWKDYLLYITALHVKRILVVYHSTKCEKNTRCISQHYMWKEYSLYITALHVKRKLVVYHSTTWEKNTCCISQHHMWKENLLYLSQTPHDWNNRPQLFFATYFASQALRECCLQKMVWHVYVFGCWTAEITSSRLFLAQSWAFRYFKNFFNN